MTSEEMTTQSAGEEEIKRIKRKKKNKDKKMRAGDQGEANGNLGTDGRSKKKKSKKRTSSDLDSKDEILPNAEVIHKEDDEYDPSEPTMAEKLASLDLVDVDKSKTIDKLEPSSIPTPSADSVHVLLKQALHADDHALLLDCLYSRDEKVIAKSTSLLNPADVLKLLKSLTSMIQQRGAVLVCALPWLRSLLTQHASSIASQESSLVLLNSVYQLIDSRISTFRPAVQLSTCLDVIFARIPDDETEEESAAPPIIYEDHDSDDEEDDAMETDKEHSEDLGAIVNSPRGSDGSEVMSD